MTLPSKTKNLSPPAMDYFLKLQLGIMLFLESLTM